MNLHSHFQRMADARKYRKIRIRSSARRSTMNYLSAIVLWITVECDCKSSNLTSTPHYRRRLTAVSFSPHAERLFQRVRNNESPYHTGDPARFDERIRESICRDVTDSGFLRSLHFIPVDKETIYRRRKEAKYSKIFHQIYDRLPRSRQDSYVYTNYYRRQYFWIAGTHWVREYVFVCPVQHSLIYDVDSLYVSKEYNLSPSSDHQRKLYVPGRFVIGNFMPAIPSPFGFDFVLLAEEPANAHTAEEGFNVEFYYLRIRKYVRPAESNKIDPLCKLMSINHYNTDDQHHRFCTAVSASSYFIDRIAYVLRSQMRSCSVERVSFKTTEGIAEADGKSFYERMAHCSFIRANHPKTVGFFYISRAYSSNQVLVYSSDPADGRIYLNNLSTNISILDELNSFDFVE